MATFRSRFASKREIMLVFAACVVMVYSWSILKFFEKLSSWLLFLKFWDIIAIFAYIQTFALIESFLVLLILILLSALLPARFLREGFVARGSMMVFLTAAWAVSFHSNAAIIIRSLTRTTFLLWSGFYLVSLGLFYLLLHRSERVEAALNSFAERLTVLFYVYIFVTCLSVIIIIIRGIFP